MKINPDTFNWGAEKEIYTIKELKERIQYAGRASTTWLSIWLDGVSIECGGYSGAVYYYYHGIYAFTGAKNMIYTRLPDSVSNSKNSP